MKSLMYLTWFVKFILSTCSIRIFGIGKHIFVQPKTDLRRVDYEKIYDEIRKRSLKYPDEVFLHINCYGGEVDSCFADIVLELTRSKNITTTTFGAESAPAFLFLATTHHIIWNDGKLGLHGAFARFPIGKLVKISEKQLGLNSQDSQWLMRIQDLLRTILEVNTCLPQSTVESIMSGHVDVTKEDLSCCETVEHVV